MNVNELQLKSYIEVFYKVLKETAEQHLPKESQQELRHLSLLPAKILVYVSTQFGVCFEYIPAQKTTIETLHGPARIEDLLLRAPRQIAKKNPGFSIEAANIGIFNCIIKGTFPFRLRNEESSLKIGDLHFEDGGWSRDIAYAEIYGSRKSSDWNESMAISRAKDEVLAATVEIAKANRLNIPMHEYIARCKNKTILVLGKYDGAGRLRLETIKRTVANLGYTPFLLDEVPDNMYQDLDQKVTTLGNMSRFIVIDDTAQSGHIAELKICETNKWVTAILRKNGRSSSAMTASPTIFSTVMEAFAYDPDNISPSVENSVRWAENKLTELKRTFDSTYPWRTTNNQ